MKKRAGIFYLSPVEAPLFENIFLSIFGLNREPRTKVVYSMLRSKLTKEISVSFLLESDFYLEASPSIIQLVAVDEGVSYPYPRNDPEAVYAYNNIRKKNKSVRELTGRKLM